MRPASIFSIPSREPATLSRLFGGDRKAEDEFRSLAEDAPHLDAAVVGLHDLPGDEQAQSEPRHLAGALGPLELLEDPLLVLGRDAHAAVADRHRRLAALDRQGDG